MKRKEKKLSGYIDTLNNEKMPKKHSGKDSAYRGKKITGSRDIGAEMESDSRTKDYRREYERLTATVRRIRTLKEPVYPEPAFEQRLSELYVAGSHDKDTKKKHSAGKSAKLRYVIIGAATLAAAAALFFILPDMGFTGRNTNIAYAMEQALKELKAYHGRIEVVETNEAGEEVLQSSREVYADQEGDYYLKELSGYNKGIVTVNDRNKEWQIRPDEKRVYVSSAFPDPYRFTFELGNEVEDVENARSVKQIGEERISGREALVLEITPNGGASYHLWIDKQTKLPLQRQSAMQNAVRITVTYTSIEFIDTIPASLLTYRIPAGYEEEESSPEQIVATTEEARNIIGFMPKLPGDVPEYALQDISVLTDSMAVKLSYKSEHGKKTIIITQVKVSNEIRPASNARLGTINSSMAEFLDNYQGITGVNSIRWQENGIEFNVYGDDSMDILVGFAKKLTTGEVVQPTQQVAKPRIEVPVDLTVEENNQKSVDAGNSPWMLDPVYVAHVYANMLISPQGIIGEYPIPYEAVRLISNNGTEAVVQIDSDKSAAVKIYLKRLIRQDDSGIWTVTGYDPAGD